MAKQHGKVTMSATDKSRTTHTMTSDGSGTGRTTVSGDGSVVQTDDDQVIRERPGR